MMLPMTAALALAGPPTYNFPPVTTLPPIVTTNVIANPGFESGMASWSTTGGSVSYFPYNPDGYTPETTTPYAGYTCSGSPVGAPHGGKNVYRLNPNPFTSGQADMSHSFLRQTLAKPVSPNMVIAASVWSRGLYGNVKVTVRYTDGTSSVGWHACVYTPEQPWERWSFQSILDPSRMIASVEFGNDSFWLNPGGVPPIDLDDVSLTIIGKA